MSPSIRPDISKLTFFGCLGGKPVHSKFASLAITKSSLTILLPSPINFCTNSDPDTLKMRRIQYCNSLFKMAQMTGVLKYKVSQDKSTILPELVTF